jgi:integrase
LFCPIPSHLARQARQLADQIGYARPEGTLPAVLTQDQVLGLIKAEPDLMMRTIFITIYAAGLCISEVIRLTTGRHQWRAHGDPRATGQRPQGSLRDAVG